MKAVHLTSVHNARDTRIYEKECMSLAQAGHEVVLVAAGERDEIVNGIQIRAIHNSAGRFSRMTRGVCYFTIASTVLVVSFPKMSMTFTTTAYFPGSAYLYLASSSIFGSFRVR